MNAKTIIDTSACLVLSVFQIDQLEDEAFNKGYEQALLEIKEIFIRNPDKLVEKLKLPD